MTMMIESKGTMERGENKLKQVAGVPVSWSGVVFTSDYVEFESNTGEGHR